MISPHYLTSNDYKEMYVLYWAWQAYLLAKDFNKADKFRELYKEWDIMLGTPWTWIPLYEATVHRYTRIQSRKTP